MKYQAASGDFMVAWTLAFCSLAVACGLAFGQGGLTVGVVSMSAIPPLASAWCAARQKSMVSPFALFAGAYGAYNGLLLLRLAFLDPADYPYPIDLSNGIVLKSGLLSALGGAAIGLAWLLGNDREPLKSVALSAAMGKVVFRTGIFFFLASIGLYWLQLQQVGGYIAVMSTERVQRFQMMKDTVSTPFLAFASTAAGLMLAGSQGSRGRRRTAWAAIAVWGVLLSLQGDRSSILRIAMVSAVVLGTLRPKLLLVRKATVAGAALVILVALVFAQARVLISLHMQGGEALSYLSQNVVLLEPWKLIMPENTDMGGPYVSVLEAVSVHRDLLLGGSYLNTLPSFLPRYVYPGLKPEDLSNQLAETLSHDDLYPMGWGYSPVAEAYRNFGLAGVPMVMAAWGALFLWLGRIQGRGLWGMLLSALFMIEALFVNRIDFRTIYLGMVFNGVVLLLAIGAVTLFSPRGSRCERLCQPGIQEETR